LIVHQNQIHRAQSKEPGPIFLTLFKKKKRREREDDIGRDVKA